MNVSRAALGVVLGVVSCSRGSAPPDVQYTTGGSTNRVCTECGSGGNALGGSSSGGSSATGGTGNSSSTGGTGAAGKGGSIGEITYGDFELVPDFEGPCEREDGAIDINLGHSAETAVTALHCQIFGSEPSETTLAQWSQDLRETEHVRRIDVARTFCQLADRECSFHYSDPWQAQVLLEDPCTRKTTRDLGAVFMFFSECPTGVNCGMDWANTHSVGMQTPHALLAFEPANAGYYNPGNPGFWKRQLLDARWAGLQFLLLNVYGPDLQQEPYPLTQLGKALAEIEGGIQVALFDDTWAWGNVDNAPWSTPPSFDDSEAAAQALYHNSWKPFYDGVAPEHWYQRDSRPFIYFYNAGTLGPRDKAAAVVSRMKELFEADFGVVPFVAVDTAFFEDPGMEAVADSRFIWNTFTAEAGSRFTMNGVTLQHAMVKWDPVGRDKPGAIATAADGLHKGPKLLEQFLADSNDADLAVIGTWNDLGEGTGIGRNYDYFYGGSWLPPHAFMSLTRAAQCND